MMQLPPLRCGWLGPRSDGLGWLFDRIQRFHVPLHGPLQMIVPAACVDTAAVARLVEGGLDRLVLACSDRLSFPVEELAWLQQNCPEIPVALAVDQWWDGSRRSGIGSAGQVQLPWYRWWDGWTGWLCGLTPEWYAPCPLPQQQIGETGAAHPMKLTPALCEGVVVANCRQSGEAWVLAGQACGANVRLLAAADFAAAGPEIRALAGWVLWDDSCMDSCQGWAAERQSSEFFGGLGDDSHWQLAIAALSMPRLDAWRQLEVSFPGRFEMLAKPSNGLALSRLLAFAGRG